MDRFLPIVLVSAAVAIGLLGCQKEPSGEYRTYAEAQAENGADDPPKPLSNPIAESSKSNAPDETVERASRTDSPVSEIATADADRPIEPELTPESQDVAENADDAAAASVAGETETRQGRGDGGSTSKPDATEMEAAMSAKSASNADPTEATIPSAGDIPPAVGEAATSGSLADRNKILTEPREIKLLIPEKSFKTEGPEGAIRVSYDDLNLLDILNMEPVPPNAEEYFPDWLHGLDGRRIRIRGFMYPAFLETGLEVFVLVRDNQECCFGPGAKIYDHIVVKMREGLTTDYIQGRPFDVVGVFRIRPEADGEQLYGLYQVDDAVVIER